MSKSRIKILTVGAITAGLAAYYFAAIDPLLSSVRRVNDELARATAKKEQLPQIKEQLADAYAHLSLLEPSAVVGDMIRRLEQIRQQLGQRQLDFSVKQGNEARGDTFREITVTIEGECTGEALARLLYELSYVEAPFRINRLALTANAAPDVVSFTLEGSTAILTNPAPHRTRASKERIFSSRPGFEQFAAIATAKVLGPRAPTPLQPPPPGPPPQAQFFITGITLDVDQRRKAYLEDRHTREFRCLAEGDELGPYKIEKITAETVLISRGGQKIDLRMGDGAAFDRNELKPH